MILRVSIYPIVSEDYIRAVWAASCCSLHVLLGTGRVSRCRGFSRVLCRIQKGCLDTFCEMGSTVTCSLWKCVIFLCRFCLCHAMNGFHKLCKWVWVLLVETVQILCTCWANCESLGWKGHFVGLCSSSRSFLFCCSAVSRTLKCTQMGHVPPAVVTVLLSCSPLPLLLSALLQWADEESGIQPTFQNYLEGFEAFADWEGLVHSRHTSHKEDHGWGNSNSVLWYVVWDMCSDCTAKLLCVKFSPNASLERIVHKAQCP